MNLPNETVRAGVHLRRAVEHASQLNALLMSAPGADDEFKRSVRTIEHAVWLARWELGLVAEEETTAESEAA